MWRRLFIGMTAFLLIVVAALSLHNSAAHAFIHGSILIDPPTPDAAATLKDANDALAHTQDLLNIINTFTAILGVVLAFLGIGAAILAILGIRTYKEIQGLTDELHKSIKETRLEAHKTREALIYLNLGDRLLNQKAIPEARENYHKVSNLLPKDAQMNYILGRIYSGLGDTDAAISAFEASHPEDIIERANVEKELGLAYRRRGDKMQESEDYDRAIQHLKSSLTLNPQDADTSAIIGGLYRRKKEYLQAITAYEKALHINPRLSYALGNLASLSWYLEKMDDAKAYFEDTERIAQRHLKQGGLDGYWDYYDLALAQLALGKTDEAKSTYRIAINLTPGKVQIDAVLDNLKLLQRAPQKMPALDDIIEILENANQAERD